MRLIFIIVCVGLLTCISSHVSALRVFDGCDDTSSCPDGSKCVWRGCDGRKCICQNEKLPSPDSLSCVPGKDLGDVCKPDDVCRGQPFSECLDSKCVCLEGYLLSTDKSHCVPRMKGNATGAEYGQVCSVNNEVCVFDLVCRMGVCGCPTGYRIATKVEIFADPFDYRMCVPEGFSIGKPVDVNGPGCHKSGTTTPTTTSSSSTTVTTTPTTTITTTTTSTPSTLSTKPTTTPKTAPPTTISSTTSTTTSTSTTTTSTTTTMPSTTTRIPSTTTRIPSTTTTMPSTTTRIPSTTTTMPSTTNAITSSSTPTTSITTVPSTTAKATPPSTTSTSSTKSTTTTATTTATPSSNPSQSTTIEATTTSQFTKSIPNTGTTITTSTLKTPSSSSPPPSSTTSPELSTQRSSSTNIPSSTVTTIPLSISTGKTITSNKTSSTILHATITKYHSFSLPSNASTAHQTHMSSSSSSSTSSTAASNLSSLPFSSPFTNSTSSSSINTSTATTETVTSTINPTVGLGDPCLHKACPDNSECVQDSCKAARCRCVLGYAESPDQETCWKLATLGEICGTERICQGSNTICSDRGICECESGFERSDSGRWCRLKSSWFIDFPVIGEECTGSFSSECYMYFEQECVNGKCRCKEGFREVKTITDQNAVYPDIVQCRNASYDADEREAMMCSNQSKERGNHDVYDRAKSKIHKIQGAIIGGSVGFVAFLGIVIGILVLIRFKRKGRQRAIKDTSSTASTDATSRYSFKIPRPFTHFVGSKEFDSTHIAYPNTVFDKDEREEPTVANNEPKPDVVNVGTLLRQSQNQT